MDTIILNVLSERVVDMAPSKDILEDILLERTKQIEIIGTFVAPEFNSLTMLVAAVGVASILVLSSRKLRWRIGY